VKRQEVGELCCKIAGIYTLIAAISITLSALLSFISMSHEDAAEGFIMKEREPSAWVQGWN